MRCCEGNNSDTEISFRVIDDDDKQTKKQVDPLIQGDQQGGDVQGVSHKCPRLKKRGRKKNLHEKSKVQLQLPGMKIGKRGGVDGDKSSERQVSGPPPVKGSGRGVHDAGECAPSWLSILTINVNGLRESGKFVAFENFVAQENPDVLIVT